MLRFGFKRSLIVERHLKSSRPGKIWEDFLVRSEDSKEDEGAQTQQFLHKMTKEILYY